MHWIKPGQPPSGSPQKGGETRRSKNPHNPIAQKELYTKFTGETIERPCADDLLPPQAFARRSSFGPRWQGGSDLLAEGRFGPRAGWGCSMHQFFEKLMKNRVVKYEVFTNTIKSKIKQ